MEEQVTEKPTSPRATKRAETKGQLMADLATAERELAEAKKARADAEAICRAKAKEIDAIRVKVINLLT